jgi:uncharacterized membrane protein YjfL (UPF0719 family)
MAATAASADPTIAKDPITEWRRTKYIEAEKMAATVGIEAIKTWVLINAGALVAIFAFMAQQIDKSKPLLLIHIIKASHPFGWGLIAAVVNFVIYYIYQSLTAYTYEEEMKNGRAAELQLKHLMASMALLMLIMPILSVLFFILGAWKVSRAFLLG